MPEYTVRYEIDVNAGNPQKAAEEVEAILEKMIYRPALTVVDNDGKSAYIDLETGKSFYTEDNVWTDEKVNKAIKLAIKPYKESIWHLGIVIWSLAGLALIGGLVIFL